MKSPLHSSTIYSYSYSSSDHSGSMVEYYEQEEDVEEVKRLTKRNHLIFGEGKLLIKLNIPPKPEPQLVSELEEPQLQLVSELEEEEEENTETNTERNNDTLAESKRFCPQCFKGFSSGKALGGHMRIHAQSPASVSSSPTLYNNHLKKLKKQQHISMDPPSLITTATNNNNGNTADQSKTTTTTTCSLCGKSFPSRKSLFGHMRCHPDREWRGIQPPPAALPIRRNTLSSPSPTPTPPCSSDVSDPKLNHHHHHLHNIIDSSDSAADADDLTNYVPSNWSVTDRRGRKPLRTPRPPLVSPSVIHDDNLRGALVDFMTFQETIHNLGASNCNSAGKIDVKDDVYGSKKKQKTEMVSQPTLRINEGGSTHSQNFCNSGTNKGKGKALVHEYYPEDDESDSRNRNRELLTNNDGGGGGGGAKILTVKSNNKKRKKVRLMADLESTEEEGTMNRRYRCDICNKGFLSHQSLGGHRSSHNKFKLSIIDAVIKKEQDHHDDKSQDEQKHPQPSPRQQIVVVEETHQCKICNKTFLTGQALGGHKRCHWTPPQLLAKPQPAPSVTSSAEASRITGRRVLDFDLNEMPSMDEEEEEHNWDSAELNIHSDI